MDWEKTSFDLLNISKERNPTEYRYPEFRRLATFPVHDESRTKRGEQAATRRRPDKVLESLCARGPAKCRELLRARVFAIMLADPGPC